MSIVLLDLTVLSTAATRTRGIGRYAVDLARSLVRRAATDQRVGILVLERLGWRDLRATGDVEAALERLTGLPDAVSHAAWAHRVRLRLRAAARRHHADLVHSVDPDATPIGLACRRVLTCHDLINTSFPEHYATSWREGWARGRRFLDARRYRRADHIIAVSHATARDLVTKLEIPQQKITVIANGVDLERFSPISQRRDESVRRHYRLDDVRYLLYVGGADWRKNPEGMLDAIARVRHRLGVQAPVLAWAGALDAVARGHVRRLADERRLGEGLRLLGWIPDDDLAALGRGAAALLFVSRAEGFGYPLVEAMALGCPVIAGNRMAAAEVAGDAALLVDPELPDAVADAILRLLADHDGERRRLIERGLARCRAFDVDRMADETLEVYRRVAGDIARRAYTSTTLCV